MNRRHGLIVPSWVPKVVAQQADVLYERAVASRSAQHVAVVERLATDPKMEAVWKELAKKRRDKYWPTNSFFHPATLPNPDMLLEFMKSQTSTVAALQEASMAYLLHRVVFCAFEAVPFMLSRPKPHPKRREWEKMAKRLREDATEIRRAEEAAKIRQPGKIHDEFSDRLLDAALVYGFLADNPITITGKHLFTERNRGDAEARALATSTAHACLEIFGTAMYTTVATITGVALGRQINWRMVREWCNSPWGRQVK
jgi:hypothetical protein